MRTFLTLVLAAVCIAGYSQKKPKINQALSALENGELAEAKTIIDEAIVHEKTKDDPKTWYYRGQIYAALDTANSEPGALDEALEAFNKALELDPEQKSLSTVDFTTGQVENVDSKIQGWYAHYYTDALSDYNLKDFLSAAEKFETAFYINPSDTNAILNAAFASVAAGNDEKAEENFNKAYEAGSRDKTIFLQLYNYAIRNEDFEGGLEIIRKAKSSYPNDVDFAKYEINLLIQLERTEEAKAELENAITADPENADLLFSLGVLKEELGEKEGAMESYNKALEIDPNHFNSNFNIGVASFNEANELIKERNALSYKQETKYKELTTKINVKLEEALPYWEKLYSLKSEDQTVLETLAYIYTSLKMNDKAEKMQDELDALGGN
ncbi:MAG: tetratricopeptide repeat protein [Ekhidna sp.]|uniref:tetratricopeptide repeat protein n=1 Tax=Ekhidna sp. TaxID=2608089 RepID=UPI0032EDCA34